MGGADDDDDDTFFQSQQNNGSAGVALVKELVWVVKSHSLAGISAQFSHSRLMFHLARLAYQWLARIFGRSNE